MLENEPKAKIALMSACVRLHCSQICRSAKLSRKKKNLLLSFWNWSIINILRFELFIPMVKLNELACVKGLWLIAFCVIMGWMELMVA